MKLKWVVGCVLVMGISSAARAADPLRVKTDKGEVAGKMSDVPRAMGRAACR